MPSVRPMRRPGMSKLFGQICDMIPVTLARRTQNNLHRFAISAKYLSPPTLKGPLHSKITFVQFCTVYLDMSA